MGSLRGREILLISSILLLLNVTDAKRGRHRHFHCPHFRPGGPYPGLHSPLVPCTTDDECRPHECCCDFEGMDFCLPEEFEKEGSASASSNDCPDFTKVPPPNATAQTCVTENDCGNDEECCPYQGNTYCVPEKDEHDKHHGDDDDDDCEEYDDDDHHKHGHDKEKKKRCHHGHLKKALFMACLGVIILVTIVIASLCIMKKCCAKKRRINSLVDVGTDQKPIGRGMNYRVSMQSEPTKQSLKEKEALEGWAQRVLTPPTQTEVPPPMYSPTAPPAYTSSPPPSYHI